MREGGCMEGSWCAWELMCVSEGVCERVSEGVCDSVWCELM